jgi:hypothetical protein
MNKFIVIFLFFNSSNASVFHAAIEESNPATVFKLLMNEHEPTSRDVEHSHFKLGLIFSRLTEGERLSLRQFKSGAPSLAFSFAQIRQRTPLFTDLIINCMIRYPESVKKHPEGLKGFPLGRGDKWHVEEAMIRYITHLHTNYSEE